jgi:hypothetical protein
MLVSGSANPNVMVFGRRALEWQLDLDEIMKVELS